MKIPPVPAWLLSVACVVLLAAHTVDAGPPPKEEAKGAIEHCVRQVEGWSVHVDKRLLGEEHGSVGRKALRILGEQLFRIAEVVPEDRVAKLREVPIWLDLDHPLGNLQYHPSAGWLRKHKYDPAMARAVHIPRAGRLINLYRRNSQPWVILHELAHAYHDRVLGFDYPPIVKAYDRVVEGKKFASVLHNRGKKVRHYALTNHKEFFAEMTECYFGTNDFYPFVRAELAESAPDVLALMEEVWGKPRKP
jgi:hypothetical protein